MKLHELSPAAGSARAPKRLGRGPGSGTGKTAGRGMKGQRSRTGYSSRLGFEGGQMPLIRRVPKRGFTNIFRIEYGIVNLSRIAEFVDAGGEEFEGEITPELLIAKGFLRPGSRVKILGDGEIARAIKVKAHRFSRSARKKIEAAGGSCEELSS